MLAITVVVLQGSLVFAQTGTSDPVERFLPAPANTDPQPTPMPAVEPVFRYDNVLQLKYYARGFVDGYGATIDTREPLTLLRTKRWFGKGNRALSQEYLVRRNKALATIERSNASATSEKRLISKYQSGFADGSLSAKGSPRFDRVELQRALDFNVVARAQTMHVSAADADDVLNELHAILDSTPHVNTFRQF